ncbi:MAG: AAA family ATPase [Deltaproteobacteria bacterium]|nr:MAG: AAA family ATPase [Deltaproteobacteria bacterium]
MLAYRLPGVAVSHSERLRAAIRTASEGLVAREALVELVVLAAVAREHLLVIGPPGTAKSEAIRRTSKVLGARTFEYLLGRFTEPSEIFGPVDLGKLRDGVVETRTEGMLPEAEIAFLDEVFLGSTAILNTLLAVLNERVFRRGHTAVRVPLRVCVGASNALPEEEGLAAFADRFVLRTFVAPIPDPQLEDLLEGGWGLAPRLEAVASVDDLDALADAARAMDLAPVRPALARAIRSLRGAGVSLSDRTAVKTQKLVAAAAALAGREVPTEADLWPLIYALPTAAAQALARDVLRDQLEHSQSSALVAAAEEASLGPAARAVRLAESGASLLERGPGEDALGWRLRLEGILREIDAGFAPEHLPPALGEVRGRIAEAVNPS